MSHRKSNTEENSNPLDGSSEQFFLRRFCPSHFSSTRLSRSKLRGCELVLLLSATKHCQIDFGFVPNKLYTDKSHGEIGELGDLGSRESKDPFLRLHLHHCKEVSISDRSEILWITGPQAPRYILCFYCIGIEAHRRRCSCQRYR